MKSRSLPLGVDIGTTRLRVAHAVVRNGRAMLRAVAVRELSAGLVENGMVTDVEHGAAVLEEAVQELETAERRCVGAIGFPYGCVRGVTLPKMTPFERERAALFEASRYAPTAETVVRLHPVEPSARIFALGVADKKVLESRVATMKRAGLLVRAVDDEGCALRRAYPDLDLIIDIGAKKTRLYARDFRVFDVPAGGDDVTGGIARDLCVGLIAAEKRKRILGTSGAGEHALRAVTKAVAGAIELVQSLQFVERAAVLGNGCKAGGLVSGLTRAAGIACEVIVSSFMAESAYSPDVACAAVPDWGLVSALAARR